jgi:hypothetical protein
MYMHLSCIVIVAIIFTIFVTHHCYACCSVFVVYLCLKTLKLIFSKLLILVFRTSDERFTWISIVPILYFRTSGIRCIVNRDSFNLVYKQKMGGMGAAGRSMGEGRRRRDPQT